eukprot:6490113-Amphidinium_carterae.1
MLLTDFRFKIIHVPWAHNALLLKEADVGLAFVRHSALHILEPDVSPLSPLLHLGWVSWNQPHSDIAYHFWSLRKFSQAHVKYNECPTHAMSQMRCVPMHRRRRYPATAPVWVQKMQNQLGIAVGMSFLEKLTYTI